MMKRCLLKNFTSISFLLSIHFILLDIYPSRAQVTLRLRIPDFQINQNSDGMAYGPPSMAVDGQGNFVVVWRDNRDDAKGDIFARRYLYDGTPETSAFKVNDIEGGVQKSPDVACDDNGYFVVTWHDGRDGDDIYARCYWSDGTPRGANFRVNDDDGEEWQGFPSIACDRDGNFVIAWMDNRTYGYYIYAQRFSGDGTPVGSNFRVKDEGVGDCPPSIDSDGDGNFVLAWSAKRYNGYAVLGKQYSRDGIPLANNFEVHLDERSDSSPSVAVAEDGSFIITWKDVKHNGNSDIYAQRYSNTGDPIGENFRVNGDAGTAAQMNPSADSDSAGNFVIAWADRRDDTEKIMIYAQVYSMDGKPLGANFRVARDCYGQQNSPDVKLWNQQIYTTWIDNTENGTGFNVWANGLEWSHSVPSRASHILYQNFPNPFNMNTTIRFYLTDHVFTKLVVYDIFGRDVATLIAREFHAGHHYIDWNAVGLGSGVYIYRLLAGPSVETKKLILLH